MVYGYCDEYDEELEEYEEDEDLDDEEEEVEVYDFVEEVRRNGNVIEIKISAIDVCCPVVLRLPVSQTFVLLKKLVKTLNKDEVKELATELVDAIMK